MLLIQALAVSQSFVSSLGHRLEENIGVINVKLTSDDLRDIDDATSKITVQGARYPEQLERMTGR